MEFMVIRKADADTEAGVMPSKQLIDDMTSYNEKLVARGAMKSGAGLMSSAKGARVSFANGKPTVMLVGSATTGAAWGPWGVEHHLLSAPEGIAGIDPVAAATAVLSLRAATRASFSSSTAS